MEQREIDFDEARIRAHLTACGLAMLPIEFVICARSRGAKKTIGDFVVYDWEISKSNGAKDLRSSPNGFLGAARALQGAGLLKINELGTPFVYRLNWTMCRRLEPPVGPDDWNDLADESQGGGQSRSVALRVRESAALKSRVPCNRVRVKNTERLLTITDCLTPWAELTDDHLQLIADSEQDFLAVLRRLKRESQRNPEISWLAETDHESSRKFLAIAHHAATTRLGPPPDGRPVSLNRRVAILTSRIKRGDFRRLQQKSWDWAADVLRRKYAEKQQHESGRTTFREALHATAAET